jgi:hypothetical protein
MSRGRVGGKHAEPGAAADPAIGSGACYVLRVRAAIWSRGGAAELVRSAARAFAPASNPDSVFDGRGVWRLA